MRFLPPATSLLEWHPHCIPWIDTWRLWTNLISSCLLKWSLGNKLTMALMPSWWALNDFSGAYSNSWWTWGMLHTVRYPSSSAATKYFSGSEYPPVSKQVIAGTRWLGLLRVGRARMSCTQWRLETPGSWHRCTSLRAQTSYLDKMNTFNNHGNK